ncbi:SDR family oxidoreductase [Streptomyces sp. NPDC002588]|uniref:SDR family NAD(P)-dependent oxidoreductase n=1 Tax=Streptomyces sp. NPDC002588 TaxID=3154419 RepID=UPI00331B4FF9
MTQQSLLAGKCAFISGAGTGIGTAAARLFCREGATVMLVGRHEDRLDALTRELQEEGYTAEYLTADVARSGEVADAVDRTLAAFGRLDVAFNINGAAAVHTALHVMADELYDLVMDANVRGVWNCMRHQIRAMLPHGGAIVNTASPTGPDAAPAPAVARAADHAVLGLTTAAAAEYVSRDIRINAIVPGSMRGEMLDDWLRQGGGANELLRGAEDLLRGAASSSSRTADPVEIAETAAWLLSDRASAVVGATVHADSGRTIR